MRFRVVQYIILITFLIVSQTTTAQEDEFQVSNNFELIAQIGRGEIVDMQFSADARKLAVITSRGIWFYDANDLKFTSPSLFSPEGINLVDPKVSAINPTLTRVAALNRSNDIVVWDVANGDTVYTFSDDSFIPDRLAFDLTGTYLAAANGDIWRMWDMSDGSVYLENPVSEALNETRDREIQIDQMAFSSDGKELGLVGSSSGSDSYDAYYYFFAADTGEIAEAWSSYHPPMINPLEFGLADEHTLVSYDDIELNAIQGMIQILIPEPMLDGHRPLTAIPHSNRILAHTISPDNTRIAVAEDNGTIRVWDIEAAIENPPCPPQGFLLEEDDFCDNTLQALITETEAHQTPILDDINQTTISITRKQFESIDGQWLISLETETPNVIELTNSNGESLQLNIPQSVDAKGISDITMSDNLFIITISGSNYYEVREGVLVVWEISGENVSQDPIAILSGHGKRHISATALSPDRSLLATSGYDKAIRVWDLERMEQIGLIEYDIFFDELSFGYDSETLLALGEDGVIYVWALSP